MNTQPLFSFASTASLRFKLCAKLLMRCNSLGDRFVVETTADNVFNGLCQWRPIREVSGLPKRLQTGYFPFIQLATLVLAEGRN